MEGLQDFFRSLEGWEGYLFLFLSSMGENLFPPLPGDTFVILGAFLVGRGQLAFLPAYGSTTLGSMTGFMVLYFVGRKLGKRFFEGKACRFFSQGHFDRVLQWFDRYGYVVIGLNRFLSGFRGVVSLGAGIVRMNIKNVFLLGLLSCLIWNALLMGVGVWIGENWIVIVRNYQIAVLGLLLVLFIFLWTKNMIKRRLERQSQCVNR